MTAPPFIVAEVSKNWIDEHELEPGLLSQRFEQIINTNRQRGYRLHSFELHRMMVSLNQMNETIIAVFEHVAVPFHGTVTHLPDRTVGGA